MTYKQPDTLRAAAQAVVERWDAPLWKDVPATAEYIGRLRAALAAPQQEVQEPEREWQGLTDDEIYECEKVGAIHYQRHKCSVRGQQLTPADDPQWHFAGAIEAKLKEKNERTY